MTRPRTPMSGLLIGSILVQIVVVASLPARAAEQVFGTTTRESVNSSGTQAISDSDSPTISSDGHLIAFASDAGNLVADKTNTCVGGFMQSPHSCGDIFVRDITTNETTRVSINSTGGQSNGDSRSPAITADGRYVAFASFASNLDSADTNQAEDVFVRDRETETTRLVSVSSAGIVGSAESSGPSISADGQYVAFTSEAPDLVSDDTNGIADVFVRDLVAGTIERVSVSSSGEEAQWIGYYRIWASSNPHISQDGRFVAFDSWSANLVAGDTNAKSDVFVRDRLLNSTTRVSVSSSGEQAGQESYASSISDDGDHVAFTSYADNLIDGSYINPRAVYLRDRLAGLTSLVSIGVGEAGAHIQQLGRVSLSRWPLRCLHFVCA